MEPEPRRPPFPFPFPDAPTGNGTATGGGWPRPAPPARERPFLHLGLFLATLATTTAAGAGLLLGAGLFDAGRDLAYAEGGWLVRITDGLLYALPFLAFLTAHEFGHYLAAKKRGVAVSLPFYLPVPLGLGTLGAVIRIREPLRRTRDLFDVGAAGPLAGFAVALGLLVVALVTLPPPTYLLSVSGHEGLVASTLTAGAWPPMEQTLQPGQIATLFGDTLLFRALADLAPFAPPTYELQHYPLLLAAWLGLFFTALNLLPVGQLDGGHVVYALFGPAVHAVVARVATGVLLASGAVGAAQGLPPVTGALVAWIGIELGVLAPAEAGRVVADAAWVGWVLLGLILSALTRRYFGNDLRLALPAALAMLALAAGAAWFAPETAAAIGYPGWLLWVALIVFVIKVDHPPVLVREPLGPVRRALGYLCLVIFALCFSLKPLSGVGG